VFQTPRRAFGRARIFGLAVALAIVAIGGACNAAEAQANASKTGVIDIQADRQMVTPVSTTWRFHGGDDPAWAQPGFDDSAWKTLQPTTDWAEQGYAEQNDLGWFRFRLKVPASLPSLVLLMPKVDRAYQIFADGRLAGQAGKLPPEHPYSPISTTRLFTLPLDGAKLLPGGDSKEVVVAIRLWQDSRLAGILTGVMYGRTYVGGSRPMATIFALSNAWDLLAHGNDYTQLLLSVVVGGAGLLLFLLTRQGFYGWFALDMLFSALGLPVRLLSEHFGWSYMVSTYAYIALDVLGPVAFMLFVMGALGLRRWKLVGLLVLLNLVAEMGPVLFLFGAISQTWADGLYFFCSAIPQAVLLWLMVRGWRRGVAYAKLLIVPYALEVTLAMAADLGHFLVDLKVPHLSVFFIGQTDVLKEPFLVSLGDVASILGTLGLLAVLVYRFAQSSKEEERLSSALQTAHDIQNSLVPVDIPRLGGLHTEIVYLAAEEVGGDFCQVLPREDGSVLIVIGDVSGKGLQAAMLGTLAVGALRSMADEAIGPAEALQRLNNVLLRTANKGFITCLCMNLMPSGQVLMANAGHLSPYLDGVELPTAAGLPLGIVPDMDYEQTSFLLPATARLTLMSDGVVEARAENGELYGFDRTSKISKLPAKEIAAEANRFGQEDDITVITLDWLAPAMAGAVA
jgi:hypothetical protein